ncbi:MAG: aminotransferase class IV, partial [Desulfohalobiaceae bacterium]|nr:aminotransferase class IV [Desulfohalobiaceae bacterium]
AGLFETIRVEGGRPCFLQEHLTRLERSWRLFFDDHPPKLSWETIVSRTLQANNLEQDTAALKILAMRGGRTHPPLEHSLLVTARPYRHRLEAIGRSGLRLRTYPQSRQTPLADHKTCNYLFSSQAGDWARRQGGDEALILNSDASFSETNSANLLIIRGFTLIVPASEHVLPGIMQHKVREYLEEKDYQTEYRRFCAEDLQPEDSILATNSLMGAVPVLQVDERPLADCSELAREIRRSVLRSAT